MNNTAVSRKYSFHQAITCNMCGADAEHSHLIGMRLNKSQGFNPRNKGGIAVSIARCGECGLNFAQPMPVPETTEEHYGIPPESYWTEEYFQLDDNYFARQIEDAKRLLGFKSGMSALDIGAGIGKAMRALTAAGFDVWGIEPSASFRDKAIAKLGVNPERIVLATIEDAEFESQSFDMVTFGAVLEHLYDPARAIEKAISWLRPGGVVQIEVPSSDHLIARFLNFYFRLVGTNYVTNLSPMHPPFHLYEFTLESFEQHGKMVGYEILHHYFDVCSIYHVPRLLHPPLRYWMRRKNRGMQLTVWLEKQ